MDSETLNLQLRRLVATMPALAGAPITPEFRQWLGRAAALVDVAGDGLDAAKLRTSVDSLDSHLLRGTHANVIVSILHRVLARAELKAPASAQGAFIAAGDTLNAFAAVAKVLARAKSDILMVDAYADQNIITGFAVTTPTGVPFASWGPTGRQEKRRCARLLRTGFSSSARVGQ